MNQAPGRLRSLLRVATAAFVVACGMGLALRLGPWPDAQARATVLLDLDGFESPISAPAGADPAHGLDGQPLRTGTHADSPRRLAARWVEALVRRGYAPVQAAGTAERAQGLYLVREEGAWVSVGHVDRRGRVGAAVAWVAPGGRGSRYLIGANEEPSREAGIVAPVPLPGGVTVPAGFAMRDASLLLAETVDAGEARRRLESSGWTVARPGGETAPLLSARRGDAEVRVVTAGR